MVDEEVLAGDGKGIRRLNTDEVLVASIAFKGEKKDVAEKLEHLRSQCGEAVSGLPIVLFDYGVYSDSPEIEVCLPVSTPVDKGEVRSRVLGSEDVLSILHEGPAEKTRDTLNVLLDHMRSHAIVPALPIREVTVRPEGDDGGGGAIEVQIALHHWGQRLVDGMDRVLGSGKRREIVGADTDLDNLRCTADQRFAIVRSALERFEKASDARQKYEVLSCCADKFSDKRIAGLRKLYEETGSVDAVIEEQSKDFTWYEAPKREGAIIYVTKIPFNKEEYDKATSPEEKRKYYCHCLLVRNRLDEGMPSTYCYCGTGWYKQQWEGILQRPVRIELLKSLLKGDDSCQFAIHLPDDVVQDQGC